MATKHRKQDGDAPAVLRWPTERARQWTDEFLKSARTDDSVLAVIAIGSAVRPGVTSADLDLIVISTGASFRVSPPMEVDLRVYAATGVDSQIAGGHDLLIWAIQFGKALYQRNSFWDGVLAAWKGRCPLPSAALARERAAKAIERLVKVLNAGDLDAAHDQTVSYLTHLARAALLDRGICPASRPELASQLRACDVTQIADQLERVLRNDAIDQTRIDQVMKLTA